MNKKVITSKHERLSKLKLRRYRIYGIFDFKAGKLIYVNMDIDQTELEFDMGDYDLDQYDIILFYVLLN